MDRKIEELNQDFHKRFLTQEDELQKNLNKLTSTIEVNE